MNLMFLSDILPRKILKTFPPGKIPLDISRIRFPWTLPPGQYPPYVHPLMRQPSVTVHGLLVYFWSISKFSVSGYRFHFRSSFPVMFSFCEVGEGGIVAVVLLAGQLHTYRLQPV